MSTVLDYVLAVVAVVLIFAAVGLGWVDGSLSLKIIPPSKRPAPPPGDEDTRDGGAA